MGNKPQNCLLTTIDPNGGRANQSEHQERDIGREGEREDGSRQVILF